MCSLIRDLFKDKQQIFYTTSLTNYATRDVFSKNGTQLYADRRAHLWGLTNQRIFNALLVAKGIESRFDRATGLVINTSMLFTSRLPLRYLQRSDNALCSVNAVPGIDYPLYIRPQILSMELSLLHFFQRFVVKFWDQSLYYYQSILFPRLTYAAVNRQKQIKLRRSRQAAWVKKRKNSK